MYLIDILEALVCQGDGDGEDGVGGVLVEARLAVPTEEIQSPASTQTHVAMETEGLTVCLTQRYQTGQVYVTMHHRSLTD